MNESTSNEVTGKTRRIDAPFWVTLIRGLLAAFLGLALVFQPDKVRPVLVNFMGMFWLSSGIMSVRWGARGQENRRPWPIVAGIAGIIAGLLALTRRLTAGVLSELIILNLLGGVMVLTGIIHITGGFRIGRQERHRTWASVLLGAFEVILGGLALLAQSLEFGQALYWALTIWALVGGFLLFTIALALAILAYGAIEWASKEKDEPLSRSPQPWIRLGSAATLLLVGLFGQSLNVGWLVLLVVTVLLIQVVLDIRFRLQRPEPQVAPNTV